MIIDCISDIHGDEPKLEGGDILIIAGDCTARDLPQEWQRFGGWVDKQDYKKKVIVAGNHDGYCETDPYWCEGFIPNSVYLQDTFATVLGVRIYGAPWTPLFCNWYFMLPPSKLKEKWEMMPNDVDILITHGPPYGILDGNNKRRFGDIALLERINIVKPKHHVFGHIHECGGQEFNNSTTHFHNVSNMNEDYELVRGATRIVL